MGQVRLGKYELLERVGLGGMAEVFKARLPSDLGIHKTVAIKRILPYHCTDHRFVQMFLDEARIAMSLNHPNIGQIYELDKDDAVYFLAMEFIDGPNLSTIIKLLRPKQLRLPLDLVLCIMGQVCAGLHAAHTQVDEQGRPMNIIHRDVSPHNVMISRTGGVKLIDFGIAKARDRLVRTQTGTVRGKLLYMSPEHAAGRTLDPRTDIFSAGMLMVTLLNGQHVMRGADEVDVLVRLRKWSPPRIGEFYPSLSPEVASGMQEVLDRALSASADGRFADAEQMRRALARVQAQVNPEVGVLDLGHFVTEVLSDNFDVAQKAPEMQGRVSGAWQVVVNTGDTAQTPSGASSPASASDADQTGNLSLPEQPQHTVVDEKPAALEEGPSTPVPMLQLLKGSDHDPDDTLRVPMSSKLFSATNHDPDRTPIDGVQLALGAAAGSIDAADDPVPTAREHTASFAANPSAISQKARPTAKMATMPEGLRNGLRPSMRGTLLAIGAGVCALLMLLGAVLIARAMLVSSDDNSPEVKAPVSTPKVAVEQLSVVTIASTPSGARILLNGEATGAVTPHDLEVPTGSHVLRLEAVDHVPYEQALEVADGEAQSVDVSLMEVEQDDAGQDGGGEDSNTMAAATESPTLVIFAEPEASVAIDGNMLPDPASTNEPLEITPLVQGQRYTLRFQKAGYQTESRQLTMEDGRMEVHVTLKRQNHGYLTVTSIPWAEVYVDGRKVAGSTPLKLHRLPVGSHLVTLKNPERQLTRQVKVNITPGATRRVQVQF